MSDIRNRVHTLDVNEDQLKIIIANLKYGNITPANLEDAELSGSPHDLVEMFQELVDQTDDKYNRDMINGICL